MKNQSVCIILILTLNPNLIDGFVFWPFSTNSEGRGSSSWGIKRLLESFLPSIQWNRSPIFGYSAYNHIDLGDPGEVRSDFEFRIGPKPIAINDEAENSVYKDQYNTHRSDNYDINQEINYNDNTYYRNIDYQNEIPSFNKFNNDDTVNMVGTGKTFLRKPIEHQLSPR